MIARLRAVLWLFENARQYENDAFRRALSRAWVALDALLPGDLGEED